MTRTSYSPPPLQAGVAIPGAAPNSVLFVDAAGNLADDPVFKYEEATKELILSTGARLTLEDTGLQTKLWAGVVGHAQPFFSLDNAGAHGWGPGGATPIDTSIIRNAVATLRTDDVMVYNKAAVAQPAVVQLTNSTGAASNDTVENVPAVAGDGGGVGTVSAAANLATVASVQAGFDAIERDLSDLTAKINQILVATGDATGLGILNT